MVYWYVLWIFGKFCVHLVYISGFWISYQKNYGNPVQEVRANVCLNLKLECKHNDEQK
jgi:hypothetical protein